MKCFIVQEKLTAKMTALPFIVGDFSHPKYDDIVNAFGVRNIVISSRDDFDVQGPYDFVQEPTVVIVKHNTSLIDEVLSNAPVRVILLDEDTDEGDPESIMDIHGVERYVQDFDTENGGAVIDAERVSTYVMQVDA